MRKLSILIPYRETGDTISVFLQLRALNRKRSPGKIGFFGGHAENDETPKQTLLREIKEELGYDLNSYEFLEDQFVKHPESDFVKSAFYMEAPPDFEQKITILKKEGDGQWFTEEEILSDPLLIKHDKPTLEHFFEKIKLKE